jgi:nucleoside-diphosphate-sugar epimerase
MLSKRVEGGPVIYLVTGITGTVVPVIVEELVRKDPDAFFYFALRRTAGTEIADRFEAVVATLELEPAARELLRTRSQLVGIDVAREGLGIEPGLRAEIVERVDKILHGAAEVRFDQPYDTIRISNVVFAEKVYALFAEVRERRTAFHGKPITLYYLSTAYAYGIHPARIPEDYPDFRPGPPDNTYARTKAEAKQFMLDKIKRFDDQILILEPTIIGGSSKTGRTRAYHLHYLLMMLGYLGKLPFLSSPDNSIDIVPVDWVAEVISDVMTRGGLRQGVLRLASGDDAITVRQLYDAAHAYYSAHDPVPGHVIPKIRFMPAWGLPPVVALAKHSLRLLYAIGRRPRHWKRVKQLALLEGYLPYLMGRKRFENERSTALIRRHTGCGRAPLLQDVVDREGRLAEHGYYEKILADTLATGWGGLVDFARARGEVSRRQVVRSPPAASA